MFHRHSRASLWGVATILAAAVTVARGQHVPCYFIFGDSVFDNGNNNKLNTTAKVNYAPYGVDYANGPTGRFSNGRNIPDFIAELLGFKHHIPPFASASRADIRTGVNYASGGAGIRSETSKHLGDRISLKDQINKNHKSAIKKARISEKQLGKCLYTINIGSNDYINNYFMPPPYSTRRHYKPDQYAAVLIGHYSSYLKTLYRMGARKVALFGIGEIGCTPRLVASHGGGKGCAAEVNSAANLFNMKLKALVIDLNIRLAGAKFTYVNQFGGFAAKTVKALGFTNLETSCCTVKPGEELCMEKGRVCQGRHGHVFWDKVHPTEHMNAVAAKTAFGGLSTFPFSILQLAAAFP